MAEERICDSCLSPVVQRISEHTGHEWCEGYSAGRASRDSEVDRAATAIGEMMLSEARLKRVLGAQVEALREALWLMVEECQGLPSHPHLAAYVYHAPEHWAAAKKALEVTP